MLRVPFKIEENKKSPMEKEIKLEKSNFYTSFFFVFFFSTSSLLLEAILLVPFIFILNLRRMNFLQLDQF